MNKPSEHKQLLVLAAQIGTPEELEELLSVLAGASKKVADKISGKHATTLAMWGTAARELRQLRDTLRGMRYTV